MDANETPALSLRTPALEIFHAMMDGGRPERLPFYLPTTAPVERRIVERTGRPSSEAFDTDFRGAVARCRRLHENGARVIVAPPHVLEPDVPWENIAAFVEAVQARLH